MKNTQIKFNIFETNFLKMLKLIFFLQPMACSETVCRGSQINQNLLIGDTLYEKPEILRKAEKYLKMFYDDHNR